MLKKSELRDMPIVAPLDRTMFKSIDKYCSDKLPVVAIKRAILDNMKFEIHEIYPDHFKAIGGGWDFLISKKFGFYQIDA